MKNFLILLFSTALMLACGKDKDKALELETEVMQMHDEVMPKLDEIMSLKAQLSKRIQHADSLQNEGISGNSIAEDRMKSVDMNQKLNQSDKMMMDWMNNYRGDSAKKLKPQEAVLYFETEKKKMTDIKEFTLKSIQEAKTFLN